MDRTFDALADANAEARELDEAVRSGMDAAIGTDVSLHDEDEINAELAALEAEAKAEAQAKEKAQRPVALQVTRHENVPEEGQQGRDTNSHDRNAPDRRPEQVLAE